MTMATHIHDKDGQQQNSHENKTRFSSIYKNECSVNITYSLPWFMRFKKYLPQSFQIYTYSRSGPQRSYKLCEAYQVT